MSLKPEWKDAPQWASYLARDQNGDWYFHETEPYRTQNCQWLSNKRFELATRVFAKDWMDTIEER